MRKQPVIAINEMTIRYKEIQDAIKTLNLLWPGRVVEALSWKIPITLVGEEKANIIKVTPFKAEESIHASLSVFSQFKRDPYQNPGTVMRHPGLLFMSEIGEIKQQVEYINALKDKLVERMHTLNERARNTHVKAAWRGVSALQLYRHITAVDYAPRKALFSWEGRTTSISRPHSKEEFIEIIRKTKEMCPIHVSPTDWEDILRKEMLAIQNVQTGGDLVRMKPVAPHPRLLLYGTQDSKATHTIFSNVPTFVKASPDCKIVELSNFDFTKIRKRKKKRVFIPIITRLNMYFRPFK
jgi:hypothetical protein